MYKLTILRVLARSEGGDLKNEKCLCGMTILLVLRFRRIFFIEYFETFLLVGVIYG